MSSWKVESLADICDIQGGGTPKRVEKNYFGEFLDWVTPSDLPPIGDVSVLGPVKERLSKEGLASSSAKRIKAGAVLFSSRASIGKIAVADRDYCTNQGFANFTPHPDKLDAWFLAYALRRYLAEITALAGTTTYKEVSRGNLKSFKIPVPPLSEQRRIVARIKECMDRIDEIRTLRSEGAKEVEVLSSSLIEDLLECKNSEECTLADVCAIESSLVDPRLPAYRRMIHVGGANIESRTGELLNLQTAEEEGLASGKYLFTNQDVLYSKIRPYLMKVARPDFAGLCSADMYPLRPKEGIICKTFLFMVLLSRNFTDYANSVSNRAGMPKINRNDLFAYRFLLPTFSDQQAIAEKFDCLLYAALQLQSELKQSKADEAKLLDGVLRKAFAGEL